MRTLRPLSTEDLLLQTKRSLREAPKPTGQGGQLSAPRRTQTSPAPASFQKPAYGSFEYHSACKKGWITAKEEQGDRLAYEQRRDRSLQTCHRYSLCEKPRHRKPRKSRAYVPELSAQLEADLDLTDGARRCARKLAEITYRENREERAVDITVTYLMEALHRSRRTIQRYLRLLERAGYIHTEVIRGLRSRVCEGLHIVLCKPLFAAHHALKWPYKLRKYRASKESQNNSFIDSNKKGKRLTVHQWSLLCMDGVFRSFMKTDPLGLMEKSSPCRA